jgi:hypothetical protein
VDTGIERKGTYEMALDASEMLGSAQLAGVQVNPRGMSKRVSSNLAGINAGVAGAVRNQEAKR